MKKRFFSSQALLVMSVLFLGNLMYVVSFVGRKCEYRKPKSTEIQSFSDPATTPSSSDRSSAISSTPTLVVSPRLSPIEAWCVTHMDVWYSRSLRLKCPFMKRRSADILDGLDMLMRFLVIRHKSLDLIGPPPGCRSVTTSGSSSSRMSTVQNMKNINSSLEEKIEILRRDWRTETNKGYYITGRLNTTLYRDDCLFDGPDPDMPVKGLRKYINAASHLFDHASSTAELLSMKVEEPSSVDGNTVIVVSWQLQGVLHLPWHPKLPQWTGRTKYHFDDEGLIYLHEEEWDISVVQAFVQTLLPDLASKIWDIPVTSSSSSSSPLSSLTRQGQSEFTKIR